MKYDFDTVVNRKNTNAIKYDYAKRRCKPEDAISLWVADMDFPTAPCIQKALSEKALHGIYGYSWPDNRYYEAVKKWYKDFHNFEVQDEWIVNTPGVCFAIATAIKAYTKEGESVLIQKPVYYPFFKIVQTLNRKVVNSPLVMKKENDKLHYEIDFEDFEKKIIEENVKLFIMCSPHNPGGRVWTKKELQKISEICLRHKVLVVSDEIHSDITFGDNVHTVYGNISEEALNNSVICTAPSKSFNLAGLQFSNIFIANRKLRKDFIREIAKTGYDEISLMGIVASTAAYSNGREWFEEAKTYIWENILFAKQYLEENLPAVNVIVPEGTYLLWLDFTETGLSDFEINDRILNKAKVWLDNGNMFGSEGEKFVRLNCATPRSILKEALQRICKEF